MKKFFTLVLMLFASLQLFANAEIVIYNNSTGTTVTSASDFSISSNNFKNIVEEGDNIVVTVKDYSRVGDDYPYFQIQWGTWEGWENLVTKDLSNGENVVPLTAADVTKINASTTYDIHFRTNGATSYTITKVVLRKNDSYSDLVELSLNDSGNKKYLKIYGGWEAARKISDGDLIVVTCENDANANATWELRGMTWDNLFASGTFDGRDYAAIIESGDGATIHTDGIQAVTSVDASKIYLAKKIYSFSESTTLDFTSPLDSPINVKLTRTLKAGWNTICLPFDIASVSTAFGENYAAYAFTAKDGDNLTFSPTDAMTANTPYLIFNSGSQESEFSFTDVTISSTSPGSTVPSGGIAFYGNYTAGMSMNGKLGLVNEGSGVNQSSIQKGTSTATLKAFGAYFDGTFTSRGFFGIETDDGTTGIKPVNRIEQGDGIMYGLDGKRLTNPKGLYIMNGKKYFAK